MKLMLRLYNVVIVLMVVVLLGLGVVAQIQVCDSAPDWNNNPPVFSGVASFFNATAQAGTKATTGACGWVVSNTDLNVAAFTASTNQAECTLCGNCYNVTGPTGSVVVRVIDYCDTSQPGGCGLNVAPQWTLNNQPWLTITNGKSAGRANVTWYGPVPCPVSGNLNYAGASAGNPYYVAITVRNHRYPLKTVEFTCPLCGPGYYNVTRHPGNLWWYTPSKNQTWPFQIRVTDVLGRQVVDTIYNSTMFLAPGQVQQGTGGNFPDPGGASQTPGSPTVPPSSIPGGSTGDTCRLSSWLRLLPSF